MIEGGGRGGGTFTNQDSTLYVIVSVSCYTVLLILCYNVKVFWSCLGGYICSYIFFSHSGDAVRSAQKLGPKLVESTYDLILDLQIRNVSS